MKPLVLASSKIDQQTMEAIAAGQAPRLDYLCIAEALGADVLDTSVSQWLPGWKRKMERALASDLTQAGVAWQRRASYCAWLSTSEKIGLPLALRGQGGPPHVLIAHNLTTRRKRGLHAMTRVLNRFASVVCLSETQASFLRDEIGLPPERIERVWDNVDDRFFYPIPETEDGGYLLAVGKENRDYGTLVAAARRLNLPVTIVASSLWSSRETTLVSEAMPPCVTLRRDFVSYIELRALYAGARLIVVPLKASKYAAGVNGALEAMAMGKASVVTRSPGLAEYLQDDVNTVLAPPEDAEALAAAISALWNDTARRRRLGLAARERVENTMSMDAYAGRVASIVRNAIGGN